MTSKQIYEATAIELSKIQAPTLKLYEFNYFFNQAIRQFVNKVYNIYDINQQTTDDLRILKDSAILEPKALSNSSANSYLQKGIYYVDMPNNYLHMLNCICVFKVKQNKDCWNKGDYMVVGATKLTADNWSSIIDDIYNRPSKKKPYYYIHNQANPQDSNNTDVLHTVTNGNVLGGFPRTFDGQNFVEKQAGSRLSNASKVRVEIRCGAGGDSVFELEEVLIDYIKEPLFIRLTLEELDSDLDISQVMEFPDYINQEIINELVNLVMRKTNDPSLQTHMLITLSIARPTGQLAQQPAS